MDDIIQNNIIKSITDKVSDEIDLEIEQKVKEFYKELTDKKDKYIVAVMQGIRVYSEYDHIYNQMNYKIVFENINRIEVK